MDILTNRFPQHKHKMRFFMELSGKKQGIEDCYGKDDVNLHTQVIQLIHQTAERYIHVLLKWIK